MITRDKKNQKNRLFERSISMLPNQIRSKISSLLAGLMLLSLLLPVLVSAASFKNVSYDGETVTGQVYVGINEDWDQDDVTVFIDGPEGLYNVTTATYSQSTPDGQYRIFDFSKKIGTYSTVGLEEEVTASKKYIPYTIVEPEERTLYRINFGDITGIGHMVGVSAQFNATISEVVYAEYSDGTFFDVTEFAEYESYDPDIAAIGEKPGSFKLLTEGTTVVKATYGGLEDLLTIQVTPSLDFDKFQYELLVGGTVATTLAMRYSDGTTAEVADEVAYRTGNAQIATIDEAGVVTAKAVGTTWIYAETEESFASARVTVKSNNNDGSGNGNGNGNGDGSGNGNSGGAPTGNSPGASDGVITVGNQVAADALTRAFEGRKEVTVKLEGEEVSLPSSALREIQSNGGQLLLVNDKGSYALPLDAIDLDELTESLGEGFTIKVEIKELTGEAITGVNSAIGALKGQTAAPIIDFNVLAVGESGTIELSDFGNTYVERSITLNEDAPESLTGVVYDEETGRFSFVPTYFKFVDGRRVATLKRPTNSIYTVISLEASFSDAEGHWGQASIESMASKLIAEGYEDGTFGPDQSITRAEFATLVVRALGLTGTTAPEATFSDILTGDWYTDAVSIALNAGIVNGFEDGTFRPNEVITREQLAAMVVRASAFAGTDLSVEASAEVLAAFADADSIVWADAEIAAAVEAGIVEGYEDGTFRAGNTATRAEASTMINRFLVNAGFIN